MKELGKKVKQLRLNKGLALKDLASKTQLTSSFLSQLEKGITSPSVESLRKIAGALETTVGSFFEEREAKEFVFTKRSKRGKIGLWPFDSVPHYEVLASSILNINILPLLLKLTKGEVLQPDLCPQGTEMLGVPVKGRIAIGVNGKEFSLGVGESIYLIHPRFQYVKNLEEDDSLFLWAVLKTKT
jgi:transcriptional regulator with XRE-family HTH domain